MAVAAALVALAAGSLSVGMIWTNASGPRQALPQACLSDDPIQGTADADRLKGTTGDDVIIGGGGNDVIRGRGGNDVICGRGGDDTLKGGGGNDVLLGGAGDDTLKGGPGDDELTGGAGFDTLSGGLDTDTCDGEVETGCEEAPTPTPAPTDSPTPTPTPTATASPTPSPSTPAPGRNFIPSGVNDSYAATEDQTLNVAAPGVLGNDTDLNGDSLDASLVSGPANGTLDFRSNGSFSYVPAANFHGPDSFTYSARDGVASSTPATVTITVAAVADVPSAIAQSISTDEDTPATATLHGSDIDGPAPSVFKITALPANGELREGSGVAGHLITTGELPYTLAGNTVTYVPSPNFNDADAFQFKANDGDQDSSAATVDVDVLPLNDVPSDVSLSKSSVDEEQPAGATVGSLTATDEDDADTHSFSLVSGAGDTDNSRFQIAGAVLMTAEVFDVEAPQGPFNVRIRTTDGSGATLSKQFVITLVNVNDPPVVSDSTISLPENSANGTAVGTPTMTDQDAGQTHAWSITGGNAAGAFAIAPATGAITVADTGDLNFESTPQFVLTVRAADSGSPAKADTGTVTIDLSNVNETPSDLGLSGTSVAENEAAGATVGSLSTTDPDAGDSHTYSLASGAGDGDNGKFEIANGALKTKQAFDFEAPGAPYSVRIRTTDTGGLQNEEVFSISVTNVNDAPVLTSASTFSIDENAADDSAVGTITATDEDSPAQTLTYSITSGNASGAFAIDSATGAITVADTSELDYETDSSHDLGIRVADNGTPSKNDTDTVTINLNDLNEAPVVTGATQSLAENSANGATVVTPSVADEDAGSTHTWSITGGNTGGAFQINPSSGAITVADTNDVDFETNPTFALVVQATDNGTPGLSDDATVNVNLTNVNEAPTDIALSDDKAPENASINTVTGALSGTDPDAGDSSNLTFTLASGAGDADNSRFNINSLNQLRASEVFDHETQGPFSVRIRATDGGTLQYDEVFQIVIEDLNDFPSADAATFSLPENSPNGTSAGTVSSSDEDRPAQTRTYSIVSGNTGGAFQINPSTGEITVADTADVDFETNPSFGLTVRVTDGGSPALSDDATVTVNLSDVNDAPVVNAATLSIAENSANGAAVGTATASDQDVPAQTKTFSITGGNAAGGFAIGSGTGAITVADAAVLDFETMPSFSLTVRVDDNGTPAKFGSNTVTVNLTNVNEAPSITAPATVPAQYGVAKAISGISVADSDSGSSAIELKIGAGDGTTLVDTGVLNGVTAANITGNGSDLVTILASQTKINETLSSPTGVVYTSDGGFAGLSDTLALTADDKGNTGSGGAKTETKDVTIQFNTPPVATGQTVTTNEDTAKTVTLAGTDADANALSFKVTSLPAAGKLYEGTSSAGTEIMPAALPYTLPADKVTYVPPLNQNGIGLETFEFKANDGSTDSPSGTVTIDVTAVDDVTVAVNDAYSVAEDSAATALLVRTNDTDVDSAAELIASVTQPANGSVTKHLGDTQVQYTPNANYCNNPPTVPVDTFTYTLTGGAVGTVNVTVTCVDDLPVAVADSSTVAEDSGTSTVLALVNDTDIDGGPRTVQSVTQPTNGTAAATNDSSAVTYAPSANYCNTQPGGTADTFTYTLNGGSSATVSVTVTCVDDAPVAVADSVTVAEDASATTVNVLDNDTDIDGGPKFVDLKSNSTNGGTVTITNSGGNLTYAPAANYCNNPELQPAAGNLSETFTYTLNGTPASVGTVTVTVTCVNDPPTADTETFNGTDSALSNFRFDNGTSTAGLDIAPATLHNVLAGDTDIEGHTISLVAGAGCTGTGPFTCLTDGYDPDGAGGQPVVRGTVTLETDGDFHYTPPPGHVGSDSFDYRVSDGQATNNLATGTVNINVAGPTVWFVDDTASAGGNGTSTSPFQGFSALSTSGASNHLDDADDRIFVYEGTYTSGIVLENGQKLLGHPHSLDVSDTAGRTHTDLVSGAGTKPVLSAAGSTVTLGSGNELQDLAFGNATGGYAITGTNVGTATVDDSTIANTGNGGAVDVNGGILDMSFDSVSSSGSATDVIRLTSVAGAFSAPAGTITNGTPDTSYAVKLLQGSVDFTYGGSITDGSGPVVSISNTTGGLKDFNGPISASGGGSGARISLVNNVGAVMRFDADMTLDTGGLPAFSATGGGTVHAPAANNRLTTSAGTPLSVVNTTIGADDLKFDTISSNGAANGIVLDNTGSAGNLEVTGTGGANSGGTIVGSTGADAATNQCAKPAGQPGGIGILLKDTNGVVLNDMVLNGSSNFGLLGHDVNGFTMDDSTFSGTHGTTDGQDEGSATFCDLTGSATISDSVIGGGFEDSLKVANAGGVLNRLTVSNTDFATSTGSAGDDAFEASSTGAATFNVTVTNGSSFTTAGGDHFQYSVAGSGTGNVVLEGSAFSNNYGPGALGGGVTINPGGTSSSANVTYAVQNNTIRDSSGPAFTVTTGGPSATGSYSGTITNNQIGVAGVAQSGAKNGSSGINFHHMGNGTHTVSITGNTIKQYTLSGIRVLANGGTPTVRATIRGNTINEPGSADVFAGISIEPGSSLSNATVCLDLGTATSQNSVNNSTGAGATADVVLFPDGNSTINLPGYVGPANGATMTPALTSFLTPRNSGDGVPSFVFNEAPTVQYTGSGSNCA